MFDDRVVTFYVPRIYERDIDNARSIPRTRASCTGIAFYRIASYRIVSARIAPENLSNLHNDIISERSRRKQARDSAAQPLK